MWGRKFWYRFLVITMYFNAGLIPWFLNMQMLGLTNTFWAYIIPGIVAPYNIILVKTYIESIPAELEESAQIDGASSLLYSARSSGRSVNRSLRRLRFSVQLVTGTPLRIP